MNKLSMIAAALVLFLGFTAAASAQPLPGTTVPGGNPPCVSNCGGGEIAEPGEPFNPFPEGCMYNCDSAEIPEPECQLDCEPTIPGKPDDDVGVAELDGDCGDKLGFLRRVTVSQIEGVGTDELVDIVPVCRLKSLAAQQDDVAQLRPAIDGNAVLDQELGQDGYNANDVVGVIVNGQQVVLYVHRS